MSRDMRLLFGKGNYSLITFTDVHLAPLSPANFYTCVVLFRPDIVGMTLAIIDLWLSASQSDLWDNTEESTGRNTRDRRNVQSLHQARVAEDDARLLDRIRLGDEVAFEQLFFQYAAALRRYARAMGRPASAEDLVQDVFAQLWEHRETVEVKATVRAYLYAATRGRVLTTLRAEGVRETYAAHTVTDDVLVVPTQPPDALAGLEREELVQALTTALGELPPRVRQAAELRWFGKLSHAEIAEVMGISPATVNNQLTHALRTLRDRLQSYLE